MPKERQKLIPMIEKSAFTSNEGLKFIIIRKKVRMHPIIKKMGTKGILIKTEMEFSSEIIIKNKNNKKTPLPKNISGKEQEFSKTIPFPKPFVAKFV